jgi:hypothetical protein
VNAGNQPQNTGVGLLEIEEEGHAFFRGTIAVMELVIT